MSDTTIIIIKVVLVILCLGWPVYIIQDGNRKIRDVLEKKNARNIVVDFLSLGTPFGMNGSTLFYDVRYEDEAGKVCITKCKKYWWDATIYWIDE
ncbi:MAG: hypothetical protein JNM55_20165 [Anaerolineales bacterium]|nr:hypothetical protein [Anaerolineales bacterium]